MQCPHAETFNSMLINAGKQSLLSPLAPVTSALIFAVVSAYLLLFCPHASGKRCFFSSADERCILYPESSGNLCYLWRTRWKTIIKVTFIVSNLNHRCDIYSKWHFNENFRQVILSCFLKDAEVELWWIASVFLGVGGLTGEQNLSQINEVGMVIQCVIAARESDKPVPPMKQLSWH